MAIRRGPTGMLVPGRALPPPSLRGGFHILRVDATPSGSLPAYSNFDGVALKH
jgi:hypothetical protein